MHCQKKPCQHSLSLDRDRKLVYIRVHQSLTDDSGKQPAEKHHMVLNLAVEQVGLFLEAEFFRGDYMVGSDLEM